MAFIPAAFAAIGTEAGASAATAASTGALIVGTGVSVAGTAYSAYSQYQAGKASDSLNQYNAAVENQQADVAQRDAAVIANQQRKQNARVMASQRAGLAANGIDPDTGSPLLEQAQQAGYLEQGTMEQQYEQGTLPAYRYRNQAKIDLLQGAVARKTGNLNASATLLQGVGGAVDRYAGYKALT